MLPTLLRMVRARDGGLDPFLADLERRRATAPPGAVDLVRGEALRDAGNLDESRAALERSVAASPDARALEALATVLRASGHVVEALGAASRAAAAAAPSERAAARRAVMSLAVDAGDLATAREASRALLALSPGSGSVRRELADLLVAYGSWEAAADELESVVRSGGGDARVLPGALRDLGIARLRCGRLDAAEATLRRALAAAASQPGVQRQAWDALRELHERRGDVASWLVMVEREAGGGVERLALLARTYRALGRGVDAVRAARRAVASQPSDVDLHLALIESLSLAGRLDEALAARRRLVTVAPHEVRWVVDLAEELDRVGRRAEAVSSLVAATSRAGTDAEAHDRLAGALSRLGADAAAARETERVVALDPTNAGALEALGERLWEHGERARAMATWERIRHVSRSAVAGAQAVGEVYARHDLLPEAIGAMRQAVEAAPDDEGALRSLARVQELGRDLDGAVRSWRSVLARPTATEAARAEARSRIAGIWAVQRQLGTNAARLEERTRSAPNDLDAARELAAVYARMHRPEPLEAVLQRITAAAPGDVFAWRALERARDERGDFAGALEAARRVLSAEPSAAREILPRLARYAFAARHDDEAMAYAARAAEADPDDAAAQRSVGDLYRARGDTVRALDAYGRAMARDDRDLESAQRAADLRLVQGDAPRALDLYRAILRRATDDALVASAGRTAVRVALATGVVDALAADLLGASAADPSRTVLRRLASELVVGWLAPAVDGLRGDDPAARAAARARLDAAGPRAVRPLLDVVAGNDAVAVRGALEMLRALGEPEAALPLLAAADRGDLDPETRDLARAAAAACADVRALRRLRDVARGDDPRAAIWALRGIARIPGAAAHAVLAEALRRPSTAVVAALALGTRPTAESRAALSSAVRALPDGPARAAAIVGWASAASGTLDFAALTGADSGEPWSRAAVLAAAGFAAGPDARRFHALLWDRLGDSPPSSVPSELRPDRVAASALLRDPSGCVLATSHAWSGSSLPGPPESWLRALFVELPASVDAEAAARRDDRPDVARDAQLLRGALRGSPEGA